MKITSDFLTEKKACSEGFVWVTENKLIGLESVRLLKRLIESNKLDWANWLIVRVMERKQYLAYAIFAAEQVLDTYEKKYPYDKRPRLAIEAAKKVLENDIEKNRADAYADAYAAAAAAAYAAAADADAYAAAADAYAAAAAAARKKMKLKILNYGIKLLEKSK
jgi:hypothetical protein